MFPTTNSCKAASLSLAVVAAGLFGSGQARAQWVSPYQKQSEDSYRLFKEAMKPFEEEKEKRKRIEGVWTHYECEQAGVSVAMPAGARVVYDGRTFDDGLDLHLLQCETAGGREFAVAIMNGPASFRSVDDAQADQVLDRAATQGAAKSHFKIEWRCQRQFGPHRGLDVISHGNTGWMRARYVLIDERLYFIMYVGPDQASIHRKDTMNFFDSFALSRPARRPLPRGVALQFVAREEARVMNLVTREGLR